MSLIGYARVSTKDQSLDLQYEKLTEYGCTKIFSDKESGAKDNRVGLKDAIDYLRAGDIFVIYKLDRLARSMIHLHTIVKELEEKGVSLIFIKEQIDFSSSHGKLIFNLLGSIAEFERDLINERSREGRERAIRNGVHMGRPSQPEKNIERALALYHDRENNNHTINDIVALTGVPKATLYYKLKQGVSSDA